MDISELEFVQIMIILLVITFMIVVIICLLSHYWLPAPAFLSRVSRTQTDQAAQLDASEWSGSVLTHQRNVEVMCSYLNRNMSPFALQHQLGRFQPTYPYLQQEIINLPPIICLSDGEELLPYKGPCTLQLRHPEQQLELSRSAVRAPPNRTVFDSDFGKKSMQAPRRDADTRMEDPPPSYSEAMGDYPGCTAHYIQYSNKTPSRSGNDCSQTEIQTGCSESTKEASTDLNKSS